MKIITLAGYVWLTAEDEDKAILLLGNVLQSEAPTTLDPRTKTIHLDPIVARTLRVGSHIIVTATYEERTGMMPVIEAIAIEVFNRRSTDEWKEWY